MNILKAMSSIQYFKNEEEERKTAQTSGCPRTQLGTNAGKGKNQATRLPFQHRLQANSFLQTKSTSRSQKECEKLNRRAASGRAGHGMVPPLQEKLMGTTSRQGSGVAFRIRWALPTVPVPPNSMQAAAHSPITLRGQKRDPESNQSFIFNYQSR